MNIYLSESSILVFSLLDSRIFYFRNRFISLLQTAEPGCLKVVVGCKLDCLGDKKRAVQLHDCQKLAIELNPCYSDMTCTPYFETSSLSGTNVDRVFEFILSHCLPLAGPTADAKRAEVVKMRTLSGTVSLDGVGKKDETVNASKCAC